MQGRFLSLDLSEIEFQRICDGLPIRDLQDEQGYIDSAMHQAESKLATLGHDVLVPRFKLDLENKIRADKQLLAKLDDYISLREYAEVVSAHQDLKARLNVMDAAENKTRQEQLLIDAGRVLVDAYEPKRVRYRSDAELHFMINQHNLYGKSVCVAAKNVLDDNSQEHRDALMTIISENIHGKKRHHSRMITAALLVFLGALLIAASTALLAVTYGAAVVPASIGISIGLGMISMSAANYRHAAKRTDNEELLHQFHEATKPSKFSLFVRPSKNISPVIREHLAPPNCQPTQ